MRTGPRRMTESAIQKRFTAGYGAGNGSNYRPTIEVSDFSSSGVQTRIADEELDRIVHVHSNGERALYHALKFFRRGLLEYKEQFAMDRRVTLGAAKRLGIRHPLYPETGVPVIMTLDALTKHREPDGQVVTCAWDYKPQAELKKRRVLEKLTLHKAYCKWAGIEHKVVTENSFPRHLVYNVAWLRAARRKTGELDVGHGGLDFLVQVMLAELRSGKYRGSLSAYGAAFDKRHQLTRGLGLRVLKLLWWNAWVELDIYANPVEEQPIPAAADVLGGPVEGLQ